MFRVLRFDFDKWNLKPVLETSFDFEISGSRRKCYTSIVSPQVFKKHPAN